MKPLKVYVAGASADLDRARSAMLRIDESEGLVNAHDWVSDIEASSCSDRELSDSDRARYAAGDLNSIESADVFLMLADSRPIGRGMYVELGVAQMVRLGRAVAIRHDVEVRPMLIVVAGGGRSSIFTTPGSHDGRLFADLEFVGTERNDLNAHDVIVGYARSVMDLEATRAATLAEIQPRHEQRIPVRPAADEPDVWHPPRPTFISFSVREPTLIPSLEEARTILGDDEARRLVNAFLMGHGNRGVWAVPHPESSKVKTKLVTDA